MSKVAAATRSAHLRARIDDHISRFFSLEASAAYSGANVVFESYEAAIARREPGVFIPIDIEPPLTPEGVYRVDFNQTSLTLWNPLPLVPSSEWRRWPDEAAPICYVHSSGAVIPAWNLAGNLIELLTAAEETRISPRDVHGRVVGAMSPRDSHGLLGVPAFNEACAVLVALALAFERGAAPEANLPAGSVRAPIVVLSHDNDQLRGNDRWTQAIRLYRSVAPVPRGRLPRPDLIGLALVNAFDPGRYYFDNIRAMADIEAMHGFRSTFYYLNGTGGRFGARSGSAKIRASVDSLPRNWPVGIHYNYDTFLDGVRFSQQLTELERLVGRPIRSGRAHYLRYDAEKSPGFLSAHGILFDESAGYPDRIGYRRGIAGPYKPLNPDTGDELPIWEMPMVFMDITMLQRDRAASCAEFEAHLRHIKQVGGALSLLFHPGVFFNPEVPEARGLYRELLDIAQWLGARGLDIASMIGA